VLQLGFAAGVEVNELLFSVGRGRAVADGHRCV
jgi:hypothetical protein